MSNKNERWGKGLVKNNEGRDVGEVMGNEWKRSTEREGRGSGEIRRKGSREYGEK